jgi:hypothetical protein
MRAVQSVDHVLARFDVEQDSCAAAAVLPAAMARKPPERRCVQATVVLGDAVDVPGVEGVTGPVHRLCGAVRTDRNDRVGRR